MISVKISTFLHQKMNKFIGGAIFSLLELTFIIKKKKSGIGEFGAWIFDVPIILMLVFQPNTLDVKTVENKA